MALYAKSEVIDQQIEKNYPKENLIKPEPPEQKWYAIYTRSRV